MLKIDVLAIGNAIVDISARMEEDFIVNNGIIKGAMSLIDANRAEFLYSCISLATETSAGSATNTAIGIANLGGKVAYLGKVADDHLGQVFTHDLKEQGVIYKMRPLEGGPPTARSIIFVTPDGERSMNTYLGASMEFGPKDISITNVAKAKVVYFEGYLWDAPRAREAILLATSIAHENGNEIAMTLSDSFCIDRYRDEFLHLIRSGIVDIIFANEAEIKSLYETASFETAVQAIRTDCRHIVCITRSENGSVVIKCDETFTISAFPTEQLIDTTGAGDLYAAGFLYGYTRGLPLVNAARIGSFAGSLVIQQMGTRMISSLRHAAIQEGLFEDN
ncbi:MAG: Carbohydrate kinase PfkB family [Candidatus Tokpelaia sp. JSC189]|nr:MAG: Carbohydrate kinase PfkB family [Candidatus Tokpelaia sp. JSC189]